MKILHIVPIYFSIKEVDSFQTLGGGERYPFELAKFQSKTEKNDEVQILLFSSANRNFLVEGVKVTVVKSIRYLPFFNNNFSPIPFSTKLYQLMNWADAIHGYHVKADTILLLTILSKFIGKPFFLTDLGGGGNLTLSKILNYEKLATAILCISKFDCSFRKVRNKIVINGGVDIKKYKMSSKKENFVLYVGRILPHKGIDRLIKAVPRSTKLVVAGRVFDTPYLNHLKSLSKNKKVLFIENPDDIKLTSLYRKASCFVLPSTHKDYLGNYRKKPELLGLVVIEAMASGTPVIVSSAGSLPELVENNVNGYVFKDGDINDLSKKIIKVVNSKVLIKKLGMNGRKIVEQKYNWNSIAINTRKIYSSYMT